MSTEINKPLSREEVNRNCKRTLLLLRSNKPDAADLMLSMLNESILKRYGESRPPIDVTKYSKLLSDKSDDNNTKVTNKNKKHKLKNIKKEKNHQISKNGNRLNEPSNRGEIQGKCKKTKHHLNNKISRHDKSKTNIEKDDSLRNKDKCFENNYLSLGECHEGIKNNTSQTLQTIKSLNNKVKFNRSSKQSVNNEISNGTIDQESKIHETQNTENPQGKDENESFGRSPTVKRVQWLRKSATKVRSHKKTPLHELSSRQRIQAILEKRINNK